MKSQYPATSELSEFDDKMQKEIIQSYDRRGWYYTPGGKLPKYFYVTPGVYAVDCFDHAGCFRRKDKPSIPFIEPYQVNWDDIYSFCEKNNLRFDVSLASPWFPGHTMLIMFFPKKVAS